MVIKSYRAFFLFKFNEMGVINMTNKITEGLRKSFQSTECKMANRICYGYNVQADGELVINKEEARVVRWIFDRYLEGDSFGKISRIGEAERSFANRKSEMES